MAQSLPWKFFIYTDYKICKASVTNTPKWSLMCRVGPQPDNCHLTAALTLLDLYKWWQQTEPWYYFSKAALVARKLKHSVNRSTYYHYQKKIFKTTKKTNVNWVSKEAKTKSGPFRRLCPLSPSYNAVVQRKHGKLAGAKMPRLARSSSRHWWNMWHS